jgi:hypothetical protein
VHRAELQAILNEWRLDISGYRIPRLIAGGSYALGWGTSIPGFNGGAVLNSSNVHDNGKANTLNLGSGADFCFRHLGTNQDILTGGAAFDYFYDY